MNAISLALVVLLGGGWTVVEQTDGIVVRALESPGRPLPELEVTGEIAADFYDVVAVMLDYPKQTHWMPRVNIFRIMNKVSEDELQLYVRFDSPWPANDRELVVRNTTRVLVPGQKVVVTQKDERLPAPEGLRDASVVRMPRLDGLFTIERLGPERTRVTYRADADPGGMLPDWLKRIVVNAMPLKTIELIRKRTLATQGRHGEFIAAWKARHGSP